MLKSTDRNKVLIFSGFYLPGFKGGGPIRTIANMVDQLGDEFNFALYTADRDLGDSAPYTSVQSNAWQSVGKADVFYASPERGWVWRLWKTIANYQGNTIHLNSFFAFRFSILPLIFWRILKPRATIILGPRGEFSEGALNLKKEKKKIFISVTQKLGLYKNILWHASSEFEAADIRRVMGDDVKIHVAIDIASPKAEITLKERLLGAPLRIVFVSRISPMKNLLGAVEVLKRIKCQVLFDVYGPTEDENYWATCQKAAKLLPKNICFRYCGALKPMQVPDKLAEYDLFFLPTLGENFGHVIAEALSSGLPVLISDTTPWRDLAEKYLGWDIPLNQVDQFAECIEACDAKSPEEYMQWRQSIRAWALKNIGNQEAIEQNRRLFLNPESSNEH